MPLRRDLMHSTDVNALKTDTHIPPNNQDVPTAHLPGRVATPSKVTEHEWQPVDSSKSNNPAALSQRQYSSSDVRKQLAEPLKIDISKGTSFNVYSQGRKPAPRKQIYPDMPAEDNTLPAQPVPKLRSAFDDTESLRFDDHSMLATDNATVVLRGSSDLAGAQPNEPRRQAQYRHEPVHDAMIRSFGPDWQQEVAAERLYLGLDHDTGRDNLDGGTETADDTALGSMVPQAPDAIEETPSRTNKFLGSFRNEISKPDRTVTFAQWPSLRSRALARQPSAESTTPPELDHHHFVESFNAENKNTVTKTSSSSLEHQSFVEQALDPRPRLHNEGVKGEPRQGAFAVKSGFASSNASVITTSTDDEVLRNQQQHLPSNPSDDKQTGKKRTRDDELDHSLDDLNGMTYDQLLGEDFNQDPRSESTSNTFNHWKKSDDLSQQLEHLGSCQEGEQVAFFRGQTDEDWAKTGSWFIERFALDLKQLVQARYERRKTSMQYEQKIRRQQKDIESCMINVDKELAELKKGGGQLIEGRRSGIRGDVTSD